MEYVLPRQWLYGNDSENSSDSDEDAGVPRVDIGEEHTMEDQCAKNKKVKKDDSGK